MIVNESHFYDHFTRKQYLLRNVVLVLNLLMDEHSKHSKTVNHRSTVSELRTDDNSKLRRLGIQALNFRVMKTLNPAQESGLSKKLGRDQGHFSILGPNKGP